MAGQLGLDPPTMALCPGGASAETKQALENCEAVANCFSCSIASSTVVFVVYCSASLTYSDKTVVQETIDIFLGQRACNLQKESSVTTSDPIFLYVLAPSLPKGALVEVKPLLHIPKNEGDEVNLIVPPTACTELPKSSKFEYSELHSSCCQIYSIPGHICGALVSISKETAARIFSGADQGAANFQDYSSVLHMKLVATVCIYLLDKLLCENHFSWEDLMSWRIYFTTELSTTADTLSAIFSDALDKFAASTKRIEAGREPIFNLIPVLGSGKSASMDDIVTCELLASKS